MDFLIQGFNPANDICPMSAGSSCECQGVNCNGCYGTRCECNVRDVVVCGCNTVNIPCTFSVCPTQCKTYCTITVAGGGVMSNPGGLS